MTKIKLCGLRSAQDIETANRLKPDYIGFVFAEKSKRFVTMKTARGLRELLDPGIAAVGVFVNEDPHVVATALQEGLIDLAQLHGDEEDAYLSQLRSLTKKPLIKAFQVRETKDAEAALRCNTEYVLLDSGAGTGTTFDWELIRQVHRPYFLAGGLSTANVEIALSQLQPFAVDVSSGIETDGRKDPVKMEAFVSAVRQHAKSR